MDESVYIQVDVTISKADPLPVPSRRWGGMGDGASSGAFHAQGHGGEILAMSRGLRRRRPGAIAACAAGYVGFALIIARVYWAQGAKVIIYVLSYLGALATVSISIKHVYVEFSFNFPTFISALHLLLSALVGFAALLRRAWTTGERMVVPTPWEFISRILPISFCFGACICLSNMGLLHVSPILAEIVGSINPLVSVPFTLMMGMPFQFALLVPIVIVVTGAITAVQPWGLAVSVSGLSCVLLAAVLRSAKSVLQQELMTGALKDRFDEYTLLAWSCCTSFAMMCAWSFYREGAEPWEFFVHSPRKVALAASLAVSGVIAIMVNLSHLWVTKVLGAVSSQLLGQTKSVLILLGSLAILGESTSPPELAGFGLVLFGTLLYGAMQQSLLFPAAGKAADAIQFQETQQKWPKVQCLEADAFH